MATPSTSGKGSALSKAEYLKRYLGDSDGKQSENKKTKKKRIKRVGKGMKIVDDDVDWKQLVNIDEKENQEDEDEEEAPVVAEVIDERPKEIKCLEEFRTSNKWRVLGATNEDSQDSQEPHGSCSLPSTEASSQWNTKALKASSTATSTKRCRHDSLDDSPTKKMRHDSPDLSPVRRCRSRSLSSSPRQRSHNSSHSGLQKQHRKGSPSRRKPRDAHPVRKSHNSDSDLSPPRDTNNHSSGSDLSPPRKQPQQRKRKDSDSDLSPPRRKKQAAQRSDGDLSPSRRASPRSSDTQMGSRMLSGGTAGLVSVDVLRREREDNRRHEKKNLPIEDESRNAQTVFRDKSGKKRDIELEREEQRKKAEEKAERDKKYFEWGKGLAQGQMQQQNVQDALKEAQKPLARHIDDEDLDRMLREQEREGDPMAGMLRKKKEKDLQRKGLKERPCYKGPPPPPNRFNIMPGYRWDGVDRSNGFEKKRYSRFADNKAVQEMAYKWSVEDM